MRSGRISGAYAVTIRVPKKMRGDVDGRTKQILDVLVAAGVTDDDRYCTRVVAERSVDANPGDCIVFVEAAP